MAGRVPRSLILAAVLSALVAAGALAGAAALRSGTTDAAPAVVTSENSPVPTLDASGCLRPPCQQLATTTIGGTSVELLADADATSGRLRIGGVTSGHVIETTITDLRVTLTATSLQCLSGGPSACLIRGEHEGGIVGQVVVGRSDNWSALDRRFVSDAGYLVLANVDGDSAPEVLAAQHDCAEPDPAVCAARPVYVQVFALTGAVAGCTRKYARLDRLPGYPAVTITPAALTPC